MQGDCPVAERPLGHGPPDTIVPAARLELA
jgi:hypothetical protein